jgi:hypothetical protein
VRRLIRVGAATPDAPEHLLQVLIGTAQLVEMRCAELQAGAAGENGNFLTGCRFGRHSKISPQLRLAESGRNNPPTARLGPSGRTLAQFTIATLSAAATRRRRRSEGIDLTHVVPGQKASVVLDIYPDIAWEAEVEIINPAPGAEFAILPPQNVSGNWVKVVQRLPSGYGCCRARASRRCAPA